MGVSYLKSQSLDHNSLEFRIEIRVALFCCTSASLKFLCESVLLLAFSALFFTISCLEKKLLTFKFHNLHLVSHQSPCNLIIFGSYHYEKNKALEMMMIIDCVYKLTLWFQNHQKLSHLNFRGKLVNFFFQGFLGSKCFSKWDFLKWFCLKI